MDESNILTAKRQRKKTVALPEPEPACARRVKPKLERPTAIPGCSSVDGTQPKATATKTKQTEKSKNPKEWRKQAMRKYNKQRSHKRAKTAQLQIEEELSWTTDSFLSKSWLQRKQHCCNSYAFARKIGFDKGDAQLAGVAASRVTQLHGLNLNYRKLFISNRKLSISNKQQGPSSGHVPICSCAA